MGYPMSYTRVVKRNHLEGDYGHEPPPYQDPEAMNWFQKGGEHCRRIVSGDLRRLEQDQRDDYHLRRYALYAGCTPGQAKDVLDAFFRDDIMYTDAPERARESRQAAHNAP